MVRLIAMHGAQRPNRGLVFQKTLEDYDALIREQWLKDLVERIRKGDEEAKMELPFRCPHYTEFKENKRRQESIIPEVFTFQTCIDIDDASYVEDAIKAAKELNGKDRIWKGMLLHMDYSARKKLHIDVRMPIGMTIEETQRAYCEAIGVPFDESCITPERFIYITDEDSEIYRSEHWYEVLSEEELKVRHEAFAKRGLSIDGRNQKDVYQCNNVKMIQCNNGKAMDDVRVQTSYKGIPYSSIIDEYWQRTGGVPVDGERNVRLHKLAVNLRAICENEPERLLEVIPRLGLSESEVRSVVESACKENPKGFTSVLTQIVNDLQESHLSVGEDSGVRLPPPLPSRLPKLVQILVSRTPDIYKPAVAHAVFPSLATHLYKVRFRYIDNVLHEATLMNVLMAGTGAGKDCISQPIDFIMADIRRRDEENLKRERKWKQENACKGANKDKKQRPEGLIIQEIDADMTNPAFVTRMSEADEHFLYAKLNEIELFDALQGSGKNNQQFQIMCLAFDPGNRYGQTRVGAQSVTERVCIRFNWNASTTIRKGLQYFRNVLTDGPISRINFCTIPEREIGAEIPVYGTYDTAFEDELRPYIERLCRARGEIACPQAFRLARQTMEENAEFSRLSQSRVYENLSFRANIIAWLKGCLLYVANDCKWDKAIENFVRWSLQYDLWCKMRFFGEAIENADTVEERVKPGPRNLLELLPDEFTLQDAVNVRRKQGIPSKGVRKMVNMWTYRGYIQPQDGNGNSNRYIKLKTTKK